MDRARWKVENETFNTLKNQGYHIEHNYGLGKKNLSMVFVTLMMLAFLVDQILQMSPSSPFQRRLGKNRHKEKFVGKGSGCILLLRQEFQDWRAKYLETPVKTEH